MTQLAPHVLTPAHAKLPADGGVLVGWEAQIDYQRPANKTPLAPTYKLSAGDTVADPIAPGVYVYHQTKPAAGKLSLLDGKTTVASFEQTDKTITAPLAAPTVSAARMTASDEKYRGIYRTLDVDVAQVPDEAAGVILYDSHRVALAFDTVAHDKQGATTVQAFHDAPRCSFNPDGMLAPNDGDKVAIAWVDAYGRVGKPSTPFAFSTAARKP